MPGSQTFLVPAGTQLAPTSVTPGMTVCAGPQVLAGTMLVETAPTQNGPWLAWGPGASISPASIRLAQNGWIRATAATQAGIVTISDLAIPLSTVDGSILTSTGVYASGSATTEQIVYSLRTPPGFLPQTFRMEIEGNVSMTNNVNAKTLQVRMNGIAGTLVLQSPALASQLNYNFKAVLAGMGDGATLKGFGVGAAAGFWGLSTVAYTTLARDYVNNETEFVISVTKATAGDTMQMDGVVVKFFS
jgi:hypothetical protein